MLSIKITLLFIFKIYFIQWKFFGLRDFAKIVVVGFISTLISAGVIFVFYNSYFSPFPRSVLFIEFFLSVLFLSSVRGLKRAFIEFFNRDGLNTLIVGTDVNAVTLYKKLKHSKEYNPVSFLDFDNSKIGTFIEGLEVKSFDNMKSVAIDTAIIAVSNISRDSLDRIYDLLKELNIKSIKLAPHIEESVKFKDISIEDLLARKPKDLDDRAVREFIKDRVVLITGAGGSIGSELSKQCVNYRAKLVVLVDNSEFNLYKISEELSGENIVSVMQSVVDREAIERTFKRYKPDIVLHAAAYKHVPLVEFNIDEAILNNVVGTKNLIDISIEYEVDKFVLISTDKAVRPTNVMGTTKRICELYAQNSNYSKTEIVAVRFGNVLGSSGSVIPKFKAQIEAGENITVTHPDITRYFMLIPEACQLVLQAGSIAKGAEIFILDMGEPIKIVDLAKRMIKLYNRDDIEIEFVGLRAGEKLYEELLIDEAESETEYDSIMVGKSVHYDIEKLNRDISELLKTDKKLEKLKEIVPEFTHNKNF
jgi:UDP-N-acetyl-D-glucosamine 4,6-dehydratase